MGGYSKYGSKPYKPYNKVALEIDHMNVARYQALQTSFPNIEGYVSAEEKINTLRMIKTSDELAKIKEACKWADFAIEIGCNEIAEGKSEMEILAAIEYELKKKELVRCPFQPWF